MKRKALWISIIGILLIGFVCLFCYRHYIRQKQIEQKKHTGLVSEDFPVQDIKHQSKIFMRMLTRQKQTTSFKI